MLENGVWFWAFLAMCGWFLGLLVVGTEFFGGRAWWGAVSVLLVELPRFLLPLPFVLQPRIEPLPVGVAALGVVILGGSLIFGTAALRIRPLTRPSGTEPIRVDGLYGIVRHPVMLCDAFWPCGWSLIWGSISGILLTVAWFGAAYLLTYLEEEKLLEVYGQVYADYQRRVPRLLPSIRRL